MAQLRSSAFATILSRMAWMAAARLHGDDTPVPVLARGKCATGRAWVYVRDDAPFDGADPPAALFRYSRDRSGDHPVAHLKTFAGILQADIYAVAKAMDYMLRRWELFARFLDDGRICLTNNAAERALRGIALGRKSWLFCGSDRGGVRAAAMYTLIGTAKLNDVDPQAWLADVLGRIAETPQTRLDELLPWNWVPEQKLDRAA